MLGFPDQAFLLQRANMSDQMFPDDILNNLTEKRLVSYCTRCQKWPASVSRLVTGGNIGEAVLLNFVSKTNI